MPLPIKFQYLGKFDTLAQLPTGRGNFFANTGCGRRLAIPGQTFKYYWLRFCSNRKRDRVSVCGSFPHLPQEYVRVPDAALHALPHAHGGLLPHPGVEGKAGQQIHLPGMFRMGPDHLPPEAESTVTREKNRALNLIFLKFSTYQKTSLVRHPQQL